MASRLSEGDILSVYDGGQQGLPISYSESQKESSNKPLFSPLTAAQLDLDALADSENALEAIQALPARDVYQALIAKGLQDSLEILPLLSDEQMIRIFDYDVWRKDELAPQEVTKWLALWRELGPEELFRKFRGLEEEYQISYLNGKIDLFDEEEFEKLPQVEQDSLTRLPCNTLFYRIKADQTDYEEMVQALIDAALSYDIAYAYSLLQHAAYLPPHESEASLLQFRRARLEEDGFVSYEESLKAFLPLDLDGLEQAWSACGASAPVFIQDTKELTSLSDSSDRKESLLLKALQHLQSHQPAQHQEILHSLAHLANTLCAASQINPEDLSGQKRILSMAQGLLNLGLEWLSKKDLTLAQIIIGKEHPQTLFRAGLTLIRRLGNSVLQTLVAWDLPHAKKLFDLYQKGRYGALLNALDVDLLPILEFEQCEMLKGLLNRYPLVLQKDSKNADHSEKESSSTPRLMFAPVSSLERLGKLAGDANELMGLIWLCKQTLTQEASHFKDLDRMLSTAIANVLNGEQFIQKPLTKKELLKLDAMPSEPLQALLGSFIESLKKQLKASESSWVVSSALLNNHSSPTDSVITALLNNPIITILTSQEEGSKTKHPSNWQELLFHEGV